MSRLTGTHLEICLLVVFVDLLVGRGGRQAGVLRPQVPEDKDAGWNVAHDRHSSESNCLVGWVD